MPLRTAFKSSVTETQYRHRSAVTVTQAITMLIVAASLVAGVVLAVEVFLILFLGILFGVFLTSVSAKLAEFLPIGYGWSLGLVVSLLIFSAVGGTASCIVQIEQQIDRTGEQIDSGIRRLRQLIADYPSLDTVVASVPFVSESLQSSQNSFSSNQPGTSQESQPGASRKNQSGTSRASTHRSERQTSPGNLPEGSKRSDRFQEIPEPLQSVAAAIGQMLQTTFGLMVNSLLIFFVGVFLAVSPADYRAGMVRLVPPNRRARAEAVLIMIGDSLWRWLIGRFASMLVTGSGAFAVLFLIGVPLAGTLGVITGLLTFVPNIGAAVALLLASLCALPQGIATVGMVLIAYLALQLIESYVVTPLIQQRQVSLPPALLISFQAVMGALFGFLGAAVASPILAAAKRAIELLYVEDYLGDRQASTDSASEPVADWSTTKAVGSRAVRNSD